MNLDKISNIIYPEFFDTKYIYVYRPLNEELKVLIEESGYKIEFIRKYRKSLKMLDDLREKCTYQKTFEKLTNAKGLYSIRLMGQKNIRILFAFEQLNNCDVAILLCAFQEKDDKNNTKTSYNHAIKMAEDRRSNLKR